MATFKVGQRVRVIGQDPGSIKFCGDVRGKEATIAAIPYLGYTYGIAIDGEPDIWGTRRADIAPLTDPLADAFIERIKKLAREPQPLVQVKA